MFNWRTPQRGAPVASARSRSSPSRDEKSKPDSLRGLCIQWPQLIGAFFVLVLVIVLSLLLTGTIDVNSSSSSGDDGGTNAGNSQNTNATSRLCLFYGAYCSIDVPTGIYVPSGYGTYIKQGLARVAAATGSATIAVMGGDIEMGYDSARPLNDRWPSMIQSIMNTDYTSTASGFLAASTETDFTGYGQTLGWSLNLLGVSTGGTSAPATVLWKLVSGNGGPTGAYLQKIFPNDTTILFYGRGTQVQLMYGITCTQSQFQVTLDNAQPIQRTVGKSSSCDTVTWTSETLFTASDDYHTTNITVFGSTAMVIGGVRYSTPDTLMIDNWSLASNTHQYTGTIDLLNQTNAVLLSGSSAGTQGDLFVYCVNPFDIHQSTVLLSKIQNYIINPIRTARANALDMIIVLPVIDLMNAGTYSLFPNGFTSSDQLNWDNFVASLITWAVPLNIAIVDLRAIMRDYHTVFTSSSGNAIQMLATIDAIGDASAAYSLNGTQFPMLSNSGHKYYSELLYPLFVALYPATV